MLNVTSAFKTALSNDKRDYLLSADITLKNGTTLSTVRNADLWTGGFSINDAVSSDGNFDIGAAIINGGKLILNNIYPLTQNSGKFSSYDFTDARAVLYVGLNLNGSEERIRKGTYTVDEAKYNGSLITLSLLDYMAKFDKPYSISNLSYPATLGTIIQDACTRCGVTLNTYDFPHYNHIVQTRPEDKALTFREIISYVAQIAGCFARCDVYGRLELKWFPSSFGNGHQFTSTFSHNLGVDNVVITGIVVEKKAEDEDGNETIERYMSGNSGYVITISDNPLVQGDSAQTIANWLGVQLIGLAFRTGEVTHLSDPSIEAGDVGVVTDPRGNRHNILISSTTFNSGVSQNTRSSAPTPSRNSEQRFSEAAKTYVELRKKLQAEKTARQLALEEFARRLDEAPGFYTTTVTAQNGAKTFYMHEKPDLEDSELVWKMTAEAWGVSTDGGQTWNGGMTVDGDTITRILTATGINVEYINLSGRLSDALNKSFWDLTTGQLHVEGLITNTTNDSTTKISDGTIEFYNDSHRVGCIRGAGSVWGEEQVGSSNIVQILKPAMEIRLDSYCKGLAFEDQNNRCKFVFNQGLYPNSDKFIFFDDVSITERLTVGGIDCRSPIETTYINFRTFDDDYIQVGGARQAGTDYLMVGGNLRVSYDLDVFGTKNRAVKTDHYGIVRLAAMESTVPVFSDIGSGEIDEDGKGYVFIAPDFAETIELTHTYHVSATQTGPGKIEWTEKQSGYFIVHGQPGTTFDWIMYACQRGYTNRLERTEDIDIDVNEEAGSFPDLGESVDLIADADNYLRQYQEEIYGYDN